MLRASTLLFCLCLLMLEMVGTESRQLIIDHSYPEPGNFSNVQLECKLNDSGLSPSVVTGARFLLNGTDIKMNETLDNGAVRLLLTHEKEGFYTCSQNGSVSNNSVGLAGIFFRMWNFCSHHHIEATSSKTKDGCCEAPNTNKTKGWLHSKCTKLSLSCPKLKKGLMVSCTSFIRASVDALYRDDTSEISRDPRTKRIKTQRQ